MSALYEHGLLTDSPITVDKMVLGYGRHVPQPGLVRPERERLEFLKELIGAYKASSPSFDNELPSLTAEMSEVQRSLRRKYAERPPEVASPEAVPPASTNSVSTTFSSLSSGSSSSPSSSSAFRPPLARIPGGANSRRGGTLVPLWVAKLLESN